MPSQNLYKDNKLKRQVVYFPQKPIKLKIQTLSPEYTGRLASPSSSLHNSSFLSAQTAAAAQQQQQQQQSSLKLLTSLQ